MCGIFGAIGHKNAAKLTNLGLYALQHRGEESAGIVIYDKKRAQYFKGMGLVSDVFDERNVSSLRGKTAIGHVRYSTTGSSQAKNIQPFMVKHKRGYIAIAHNGNLTNTKKLHNELEERGSIFQTSMDSEIIAHLIARTAGNNLENNIISAIAQLQGAYSLILMIDNMLVAARDPRGFRPLCLGKIGDCYVLASETCAFDLIHAEYIRDIEPGEMLFIKQGKLESIKPFPKKKHAFCIFEYIYFSRPDSNIFANNVYLTRKRLGQQLAHEYKIDCDLVMPIPDSGTCAALGYAQASKKPYEAGMIRNHYIGRTFIQPTQFVRDFRVRVKLNPVKDVLKGRKVVVVEDSIVRGTTCRARVKALREAGAKEVHMGVSCPPIISPCFYGIDFPTRKELIAANHSIKEIRDFIGLDTLYYLSLEGMLKSMPIDKNEFCTACFNCKYPEQPPKRFSKTILER